MGRAWGGLLLAGVVALGACGGATASLRDENRTLSQRLAEARAEGRRDRNHIRDLENEVYLLRDKLESAEVRGDRGDVRPQLPVEVITPEGGETDVLSDGGGTTDDGERYRVVGVDQDGVEIVYAGDAALDRSVRPSIRMYDDGGPLEDDDYSIPDDAPPPRRSSSARRPLRPVRGSATPPAASVDDGGSGDTGDTGDAGDADAATRDPVARYQRYVSALRAGNHAYAITGFRNFLEDHPDHDYADNAQYWLGEAYYDQKDYKRALVEFRLTVEKYPDGNKAPDALLKAGFCYLSMKDTATARAVLEQVVAIYPRSSPALLATARLAELDAGTDAAPR